MDTRLRSLGAETPTAATVPTHTGKDRQPQQAGLGGKGRARTRSADDGSGRDIQTEVDGREGRNGEVSHYCAMRSELDLTSGIKVTATMMFCILITLPAGMLSWRLRFRRVAGSAMFLGSSFVYTPIPSMSIGVGRLRLVEFWRTTFICNLSHVASITACCSISIQSHDSSYWKQTFTVWSSWMTRPCNSEWVVYCLQ